MAHSLIGALECGIRLHRDIPGIEHLEASLLPLD
jgi:hypothetical protein